MAEPQMSQKSQNYGSIQSDSSLPVYYVTPDPPRRSITSSRFFQALMLALALLEVTWLSRHVFGYRHRNYPHSPRWEVDMAGIDPSAEGCAVWDHYDPDSPHHHSFGASSANTTSSFSSLRGAGDKSTFSIPTASSRYHFVSWGPIDKSLFQVIPVESDKNQIVVEVEVVKDPKGVARVCALPSTGEDEPYGVGIYAPRMDYHDHENWPAFKVLVYIPISSSGEQRTLHSFETRLGQFEHVFPDLSKHINFEKLDVSAANVPMKFRSVVANSIKVANANSPIAGTFTSASDLILDNANGGITGELTLTQSGNIKISNANSPIDVQFYLKSGDFHPRPSYTLHTSNANAATTLQILSQPLNSALNIHASNAMAPIYATLNAAFEGAFKLSTVMSKAEVVVGNRQDPSGEGRERVVEYQKRTGGDVKGTVAWGGKGEKGEHAVGDVTLSSVGARVELVLN
ncbi:hypothetical protein BDV93DRAFT_607338 [Ceratobasidium sp. AG-I]|nr:hypothetical protein BDV93DRAFT_607338 [Ceratobasidium sp. AG-I]